MHLIKITTYFLVIIEVLTLEGFGQDKIPYKSVYNQGLGKMEMIEKIDEYLSTNLSPKIDKIEQELIVLKEEKKIEEALPVDKIRATLDKFEVRLNALEDLKIATHIDQTNKLSSEEFEKLKIYTNKLRDETIPKIENKVEALKEAIKNLDRVFNSIDGIDKKLKEI